MCGISVLTGQHGDLLEQCQNMTRLIAHRGPDGEGVTEFAPGVVFGHRRLSIIDLSGRASQPMQSLDGRYAITYNGEVYNHLELRGELEALGCCFQTTSDTEVVLAAYAEWGESCLHRFNGMFAFAIYDREANVLFAARDRFGIKPLYYRLGRGGSLAIASEIKQFTALSDWKAVLNEQRAYDFLMWGHIDHTNETMFEGVLQLQGGQSLTCSIGARPKIRRWYQLPKGRFSGGLDEASEHFHDLLRDSVKLRMQADVQVGSCLSGGLDSSSIVCLASDLLEKSGSNVPQHTFTAGSRIQAVDETDFARAVVESRSTTAHYCYPEADHLLQELPDIVWHQDEPFGSTSIYAQWCVFKQVSTTSVKVMLDGQGADEQLGGYAGFFKYRCMDLLKQLRWIAFRNETKAIEELHGIELMGSQLAKQTIPPRLKSLLSRHKQRVAGVSPIIAGDLRRFDQRYPFDTAFSRTFDGQRYQQVTTSNLPSLLHYEDRDSMAHSIEARVPFLDHRLVEFVTSLSGEHLIDRGITKKVLREGMKGILPEKVRSRTDKLGFSTPEEVWMKNDRQTFVELAQCSFDSADGFLSPSLVNWVDQTLAGQQPFSEQIWRVICLGLWMGRFNVSASGSSCLTSQCL